MIVDAADCLYSDTQENNSILLFFKKTLVNVEISCHDRAFGIVMTMFVFCFAAEQVLVMTTHL